MSKTATDTRKPGGHDNTPIPSPQEVKVDLNKILRKAKVTATTYGYTVDLGATVRPRIHQVGKDGKCTCTQGVGCVAVDAVKEHLNKGGQRAIRPPDAFTTAIVSIGHFCYTVDFGPEVLPRLHQVGKDRRCSCGDLNCPAIETVADYLRNGGERAPSPPPNFFVTAPETCPICGAPAYHDPATSSRVRGAGWGCSKTGSQHHFAWRSQRLQEAMQANPWRFPPRVIRGGEQIYAWDGIQQGDEVLYAGLLRADLVTEGPIGYLPEKE
jgi:hypothetical protein